MKKPEKGIRLFRLLIADVRPETITENQTDILMMLLLSLANLILYWQVPELRICHF